MIELCLYVVLGYGIVKLIKYIRSKAGKNNKKDDSQD